MKYNLALALPFKNEDINYSKILLIFLKDIPERLS